MKVPKKDRRRFWSMVFFTEKDTCWLFHGTTWSGHGKFKYKGVPYWAHRFALMCTGTSVPEGSIVRHLCYQKACVNPKHLQVGTQKENVEDAMAAGTHVNSNGINNFDCICSGLCCQKEIEK